MDRALLVGLRFPFVAVTLFPVKFDKLAPSILQVWLWPGYETFHNTSSYIDPHFFFNSTNVIHTLLLIILQLLLSNILALS